MPSIRAATWPPRKLSSRWRAEWNGVRNEINVVFITPLAGTGPRWIFRMERMVSRRSVRSVQRQLLARLGTLG